MTHVILTLITSVYVISSSFVPIGPPLVLGMGCSMVCQNNLLFAAIYLNLSRRHCRNACCYGFRLLPLMHVYACVSTKYTRTGQCVQCPIPLYQFFLRVRHFQTSLAHGHTHTHSLFFFFYTVTAEPAS